MKTKPAPKIKREVNETFSLFFLGALYGLIAMKLSLAHQIASNNYGTYLKLYEEGWIISLSVGIAGLFFTKLIREKWFHSDSVFYPLLVLANLVFTLYVLEPSHWMDLGFWWTFWVLQAAAIAAAKLLDRLGNVPWKTDILYLFMILWALNWFTKLNPDWYQVRDWQRYNYLFFAVILGLFIWGIRKGVDLWNLEGSVWTVMGFRLSASVPLFFLAFLLIGFCINTLFNYDPYHFSYYLGPVADLAGGKSLLFNINAQYGILVIYFLRFLFLFVPIGFVSFSFWLVVLTTIQFLLIYFICRRIFRSEPLAFFALSLVLLIEHLNQGGDPGILYPSIGVLRFGFVYVLMTLMILRNSAKGDRNPYFWLESLVAGIAFFWSFETCFYTVIAYLGLMVYESIGRQGGLRFDLGLLLRRGMALFVCVLAIGILLYLDIFRRTHSLPHWDYYLDFISSYRNGFGALEMPGIGYWWLIAGVVYFSLFAVLGLAFSKAKALPPHLNAIALLTFFGILQLTYYFGRAAVDNLYHISIPTTLLATYWLYFVRRFDPVSLPRVAKTLGYGLGVIFAGFYLQRPTERARETLNRQPSSPSVMIERILNLPSQWHSVDPNIQEADRLMKKYSGNAKSLVYFLWEGDVNLSMYSGRTNLYPYNDTDQPKVSPKAMERILSFRPDLKPGDYIYCGSIPAESFEKKLFDGIGSRFDLEMVEQAGGITVYKLSGVKTAS